MQRSAQRHEEKYVNALLKHTQFCPHSAEYRCTHSLLWDRWGHPPSSSSHCRPPPLRAWPGSKSLLSYRAPCLQLLSATVGNPQSSYKPLHTELFLLLLPSPFSFLISLSLLPPHPLSQPLSLCALTGLYSVLHTLTQLDQCRHTREGKEKFKKLHKK